MEEVGSETVVVLLGQSQLIPLGRSDSRKSVLWQWVWLVEGVVCVWWCEREPLTPSQHTLTPHTHTQRASENGFTLHHIAP